MKSDRQIDGVSSTKCSLMPVRKECGRLLPPLYLVDGGKRTVAECNQSFHSGDEAEVVPLWGAQVEIHLILCWFRNSLTSHLLTASGLTRLSSRVNRLPQVKCSICDWCGVDRR
jgi:hypothetical protein